MPSTSSITIKICGLSTVEHALAAATAGADLIGLVFAPSKRQVTPDQAAVICRALRADPVGRRVQIVGLFVNESAAHINAISAHCELDYVQLSGDETPIQAAALTRPVLKAIRMTDTPAERAWFAWFDHQSPPIAHGPQFAPWPWLVDAHVAGAYGGTGTRADWTQAAQLAQQRVCLLAGGLTPANVGAAIAQVQPRGVDVSSGVEHNGHKTHRLITAFIQAARAASVPA
jgi:phosphoribosylanthranilate isomerase